jgi:hypothetical protein
MMDKLRTLFRLEGPKPARRIEEPVPQASDPPGSNTSSHLKSYLDYYCSRNEPGYAVLITGAWGTGKTFQVREAIPDDKAHYVSLFGLNSTDDVLAAVYTAMFPGKARLRKIADSIGETAAEIPGVGSLAVNGLTSGLVGAFLRQKVDNTKPIIFDDLERCTLDVKETLGIINLYVEHHRCRVIVIAHDDNLTEEFGAAKEKIFGQTIRVEPQVSAAFDDFHSTLAIGPAKDLIAAQKPNILGVFSNSKAESLRILRHVIGDLDRLVGMLDKRYRSHGEAMAALVRLFSAFDIEWRANRLTAPDLRERMRARISFGVNRKSKEAEKTPPIVAAIERYSSVDLTSTLLQDHVLHQMLVEGRFDKAEIQNSLDASSFFVETKTSPPWQIVINFDKLEDEEVAEGLARMRKQFANREVSDSGEMLHIFSLLMMMASKGVLGKDIKAVEKECKSYIDDLLAKGQLPPRGLDWRWQDDFIRASHGVGYWVSEEYASEFKSVCQHLIAARGKALEVTFPKLAPDLIRAVETDGQRFFEQVCHTSQGNNPYASIPILAAIAPEDFVGAWMRSPKANWYWISHALLERYKSGYLGEELKNEREWIGSVVESLKKEEAKASGLAKVRIQRTIPNIAFREEEAAP